MTGPRPVAAENRLPGTTDWRLDRPATAREIEGYASASSIASGDAIAIFVNCAAPTFRLEVFRFGWYDGAGARRVHGPVQVAGTVQPLPPTDPQTGLADCAWTDPYRLQSAPDWVSGVYLVRLTAEDSGAQSYVLFVLRDDRRRSDLLVQIPVTTYQAYNSWGGKSLYHWGSSEGARAAKVSFNRPYAANRQNPAAAAGMGAGEFLTNLQPHPDVYGVSNAGWDCNLVRWLEREGYDVGYATSLDTHARPGLSGRGRAWLSIGHDEYWTRDMRRHVEQARDAGMHLAFLTANAVYWQVRLEPSPATGMADRVMVCYKKARRDPLAAGEPALATDKWRSAAVGQPEEALIGVMYAGDPVDADIVVRDAGHWLFRGTGLRAGDRLPGLLGYEVDRMHDPATSRAAVLAESPWVSLNDPAVSGVAQMTLYTAPSGALVFAAGTIQWAWGLDDWNAPALRPSRLNPAARRITRNLLARFGAEPGPGADDGHGAADTA